MKNQLGKALGILALFIAAITAYVVIDTYLNLKGSGVTMKDIFVGSVSQTTLNRITVGQGSDLNFANFVLWVGTISAIIFAFGSYKFISRLKNENKN